jgi:triosephosphate isomerase
VWEYVIFGHSERRSISAKRINVNQRIRAPECSLRSSCAWGMLSQRELGHHLGNLRMQTNVALLGVSQEETCKHSGCL